MLTVSPFTVPFTVAKTATVFTVQFPKGQWRSVQASIIGASGKITGVVIADPADPGSVTCDCAVVRAGVPFNVPPMGLVQGSGRDGKGLVYVLSTCVS